MRTSREIFDAYEERSWRSVARRQRSRGMEFVAGRREGSYVWDAEGKRRLLDCTTGGGVHALGHRNPEILAANLAQLGRLDEARAEVELFLVGNPHFTTRHWATTEQFRDAATLEHFVDGYRKAGLPE